MLHVCENGTLCFCKKYYVLDKNNIRRRLAFVKKRLYMMTTNISLVYESIFVIMQDGCIITMFIYYYIKKYT